METIETRRQVMDAIAEEGDATVLRFATHCMDLIEEHGKVTAEDAAKFARDAGLL